MSEKKDELDQLTSEIEQGFAQSKGWETCRYALGKFFEKLQQENEFLREDNEALKEQIEESEMDVKDE